MRHESTTWPSLNTHFKLMHSISICVTVAIPLCALFCKGQKKEVGVILWFTTEYFKHLFHSSKFRLLFTELLNISKYVLSATF